MDKLKLAQYLNEFKNSEYYTALKQIFNKMTEDYIETMMNLEDNETYKIVGIKNKIEALKEVIYEIDNSIRVAVIETKNI